jgi:response regulator RpfG family c-di-GMP phosphodiesterase
VKVVAFVAEPDLDAREALQLTLESEGAVVYSGVALQEIAQVFELESINIVIADFALFQRSESENPGVVQRHCPFASLVVLASIFSLNAATESVANAGIFGFATKPWLREELISTVIAGAEAAQMRRAIALLRRQVSGLKSSESHLKHSLDEAKKELLVKERLIRSAEEARRHLGESLPKFSYQLIASRNRRVALQSRVIVAIARKMTSLAVFTQEDGRRLLNAAALCDLGLVGIDQSLLIRLPARGLKLSSDELSAYRSHPVISASLSAYLDADEKVAEIIRTHHECFDGSGFPEGLKGAEIPWLARCLGVAVFIADNPASHSETLESVLAESGRTLDPEAVKHFSTIPGLLEDSSIFGRSSFREMSPETQDATLPPQVFPEGDQSSTANSPSEFLKKMKQATDWPSKVGQSLDVTG